MSIVAFDESVKGQRFILLLDTNNASLCCSTNNAFRIVAQTDFNSDNTIDFCVVSLHDIVRNQERISQAYEMSASKK